MNKYIFLSPHFDDIVLSCGGIVDSLKDKGCEIEIWTIFAGKPKNNTLTPFAQSLHERWELGLEAVDTRKQEDIAACSVLKAKYRHFDFPDCIYRTDIASRPLVNEEEDLYQAIPDHQEFLVESVFSIINKIPHEAKIVSPISIGNHIDHRIVRAAINKLSNKSIYFYPDYPYNIKSNKSLDAWFEPNWVERDFILSPKNIKNWIDSIAKHQSQISTFWKNRTIMEAKIQAYAAAGGGKSLWQKP